MSFVERLRAAAKEQRESADRAGFTKTFVRSVALYNEAADRIEAMQAILDEMMVKNPVHVSPAGNSNLLEWRTRYSNLEK